MDAAIGALSPERSGVGSALLMAMRQVGGTIGVAVLGAVLGSGYRGALATAPRRRARERLRRRRAGARLGSAALLESVHSAFVQGMDAMLWVCGGVAALGVVLALRSCRGGSRRGAAPGGRISA